MKKCALLLSLPVIFMMTGCRNDNVQVVNGNSAYYWSTVFHLGQQQRDFIRQHKISRLYVRYFDVVMNEEGLPMPNATIQFSDSVPDDIEIIPTVFILNDCMTADRSDLAEKIASRVVQMNDTHDIRNVKEIQIDCDWTKRTEKHFFGFMQSLRETLKNKGLSLSSTIRLHQLASSPPPADRGVLMMYNTGDFTDLNCQKPILDTEVAVPYMKYLSGYPLPLSAAYPLFSWKILFRQKKFVGIIHSEDEYPIIPTDSIVIRDVTIEEVLKAKACLQNHRKDINSEIILYEMNDKNITKFKENEYKEIFAR
ncbi:MAG: hypothetical protein IJK46_01680 [Prevotella sp.]|nr:hypothetical protein [Prevotella sp.]